MRFSTPARRSLARSFLLSVLSLLLALAPASAAGPDGTSRNLFMVSVGQTYARGGQKVQPSLPCCEKDAVDMVRWAESQKDKLFGTVDTRSMVDSQGTADGILAAARGLKDRVKAGDYAILYLSGHGGTGRDGRFEFCAYDRNLGWGEIQQALRDVPGSVIVILDACHSGGAAGDNLIVLSASLKDLCSLGGMDKDHNSLYTEFLLEALSGKADMNRDGVISLAEVDAYVSGQLELQKVTPSTMTRPGNIPSSLPLAKLGAAKPAAPVPVAAGNLAGTTWSGTENLGGYGKLTFRFLAGGKAVMTDAKNTVEGAYTVEGNQVVIRLPRLAPYRGTINGSTITGQATSSSATWDFTVSKQ